MGGSSSVPEPVSNRVLYLLLLYLINSVRHGTAQGQTVTMGDGIPAMRSTTSAVIIKNNGFVQNTIGGIDEELSKKPSVTTALNVFAEYDC